MRNLKQKILVLVAVNLEIPETSWNFDCPIKYTGIGKINASIATTKLIMEFEPDLIVNLGTAGATNLKPGVVVPVGRVLERDFDCSPIGKRGAVPFDEGPSEFESTLSGFTCGSGDNFVTAMDPWFIQEGIDVIDMELFAIAKTAFKFGIPWVSFKYITDSLNADSGSDWFSKLADANSELQRVFLEQVLCESKQ